MNKRLKTCLFNNEIKSFGTTFSLFLSENMEKLSNETDLEVAEGADYRCQGQLWRSAALT